MSFKLSVVVEKEDDSFVSHCVEFGVASQGQTIDAALANLREACQLYLKHADPDEIVHLKRVQN